jgi:photosystem II stability/assembly factor-like uncharacterized protein
VAAFHGEAVVLEYDGDNQRVIFSQDMGNAWQDSLSVNNNYCYSLSSQYGGLTVNCIHDNYFTVDLTHWLTLKIEKKNPILDSYFSGKTLYVTDGNSIQSSVDQGSHWQYLLDDLRQDRAYIGGHNDEIVIIALNHAGVIKMTNGGQSWDLINNGLTHFNFTSLLVIDEAHYLVSTEEGGVFYTQNGGQYWTAENTGLTDPATLGLSFYGTALLVGTDGGGVFKADMPP